jgi:hypothetical protein
VSHKNDPTAVVHWNEYEALHDDIKLHINNDAKLVCDDLQKVER